jgi:cobalamin synthase
MEPVNARLTAGVTVVVIGLAFFVSWLMEMPLDRAFVVSPLIVVAAGAVGLMVVLLTRAAMDSLGELRNPRRFWIGLALACVLIAILGALGVELPREG